MEYRKLGRTGLDVSAISLGTEYLINLPRRRVVSVIRKAVEAGVNYFDLFFAQPQFRDNMGAAFAGCRERVYLAAHLGAIDRDGQYEKTRDVSLAETFFEDFLLRYRTDYADVIFLHNSDGAKDRERVFRKGGLLDSARRFVAEGKARFVAFSSHTVKSALDAVQSGAIDVLMFPVSLAGNAVPGKKELFAASAAAGVGVVAMKPFAGGKLLARETELSLNRWHRGGKPKKVSRKSRITPVQCLSYALSQPGVSCAVPGCKDIRELSAALAYLKASPRQKDFSAAVEGFKEFVRGECVYCNHCLPCPSRIDIGRTIRLLETAQAAGAPRRAAKASELSTEYNAMPAKASACVECGACAARCPFGVPAAAKVAAAARLFERKAVGGKA
jgi:hypothetical protein